MKWFVFFLLSSFFFLSLISSFQIRYSRQEKEWYQKEDGANKFVVRFNEYVKDLEGKILLLMTILLIFLFFFFFLITYFFYPLKKTIIIIIILIIINNNNNNQTGTMKFIYQNGMGGKEVPDYIPKEHTKRERKKYSMNRLIFMIICLMK